jgi:hypothetical protein
MPGKTRNALFSPQLIFFLAILAGTLGWEVLVSILALGGLELQLSTGPVGFDVEVLSFYMEVNPGTFVGLFIGYRMARSAAEGRRQSSGARSSGGRSSGGRSSGSRSSGGRSTTSRSSGSRSGGRSGSGSGDGGEKGGNNG